MTTDEINDTVERLRTALLMHSTRQIDASFIVEPVTVGEFEGHTIKKPGDMVITFRIANADSAPDGVLIQSQSGQYVRMMADGSIVPMQPKGSEASHE